MKKIEINTVLTIIAMIVAVTVWGVRLEGKIELLAETNKLNHLRFDEKLDALSIVLSDKVFDIYADDPEPIVKKKKAYAGTPETFIYVEQ